MEGHIDVGLRGNPYPIETNQQPGWEEMTLDDFKFEE